MLSKKNFIIYIFLIGIYAGILCVLTGVVQYVGIASKEVALTFLSFLGWTTYYLFGATPKKAKKGLACILLGALIAVMIFVIADLLGYVITSPNLTFLILPIATAVGTVLLVASERYKHLNMTAAVFAGCGLFFAMMGASGMEGSQTYIFNVISEIIYVALGMFMGFVSVKTKELLLKKQNK